MNINDIKIGDKVYWNDPAIADYDEEDRADVLDTEWEVFDIQGDIVHISSEYGGEAEVYAEELDPYGTPIYNVTITTLSNGQEFVKSFCNYNDALKHIKNAIEEDVEDFQQAFVKKEIIPNN